MSQSRIALALTLFAGCAGTSDHEPALAGRWTSACTVAGPQQVYTMQFDLTDTAWQLDYVAYGDAACTAKFLTVHIEGAYHLIMPSPTIAGAWNAEFAFTSKSVTPHSDAAAGFLASANGCNRAGFATGQATDILDAGCAGLGAYPRATCSAEHDIVLRDGDTLRFGARPADGNLCTDDRRPTAPSPVVLEKS